MADSRSESFSPAYQLFMLVLCLYALGGLAAQRMVALSPDTRGVLEYADYLVCALFFVDFVICLVRAPNPWRYFLSWGWLDLLSSIPTVDVARWGRAARVLRIFRVLRALRATKLIATLVLRRRAQSSFLAACLVAILLIVFCSVAILHFETEAEANITTAEDAVWWAFATITTVGYGDRYPVTTEGRVVAAILMTAGVGLFGTFSGFLAAWFIGTNDDDGGQSSELAALRQEMVALREAIGRLEKRGAGWPEQLRPDGVA